MRNDRFSLSYMLNKLTGVNIFHGVIKFSGVGVVELHGGIYRDCQYLGVGREGDARGVRSLSVCARLENVRGFSTNVIDWNMNRSRI